VHILVTNARDIGRFARFEEFTDDEWTDIFNPGPPANSLLRRAFLGSWVAFLALASRVEATGTDSAHRPD